MITTIKLINIFINLHSYPFLWWEHKIYSLSKLQVYNTVLAAVTMLYLRFPELTAESFDQHLLIIIYILISGVYLKKNVMLFS